MITDEITGTHGTDADGTRIAVVGVALRYPDANTPDELWRNVLSGRRAFRRLPDERMRAADYYSADPDAPDRHYTRMAAVLEGFEFDRVRYRIGGSTLRSTDMTHWLTLDTVARALEDAGFAGGEGLPRATTGVIIGNTLTGEFSRANIMRLRWPYVRRTVAAALREHGWDDSEMGTFLAQLEERYKSPFPPIGEDSLAGGLANTISGRVCNYFDLGGGGFTVDGACSSSLLSVSAACDGLSSGQLDMAIAGGVDLSIDPFEVIGFAKTGALSTSEMRVYDRGSNGFWPGEGCGMLVLMRDADAKSERRFRYATIAGWGYSSDGKGGITRPESEGHRRAIRRAYARAGFGFETVRYIEGHGTGTAVGDATELRAFSEERRAASSEAPIAAIGTVKGNFGHTKAAAGVAGLIKAILAVHHQVIPPATSHHVAHPILEEERPALRVPAAAETWPEDAPVRAAVSSMGFGGINAHVVVEHADGAAKPAAKPAVDPDTRMLVRSRQDAELLLLDAAGIAELRGRVAQLAEFAAKLSFAELGDLAATLAGSLTGLPVRAAIVASSPDQAEQRFGKLLSLLDNGARSAFDPDAGVFLGSAAAAPRIAFLFPGQGAGKRGDGGALRRRFEEIDALYQRLNLPTDGDLVATAVAQPRIVTASVAGLRVLSSLGIEADTAAGHSLGELTALHWAGAMSEEGLLGAAAARGEIMARASDGGGAMASITASATDVEPLLNDEPVVIAGFNSPAQTVVSGPAEAVDKVCGLATARGLTATRLNVSHAFHSPEVAPAADELRRYLEGTPTTPMTKTMVSTVTGNTLPPDTDVPELLAQQVRDPVRFSEAVKVMAATTDLFIEVGPGRVLQGLAGDCSPGTPAVSVEADSQSLSGLLRAVGAAYALGAPVRAEALFNERYVKPIALDKEFRFLASPCEAAPQENVAAGEPPATVPEATAPRAAEGEATETASSLDILRRLIAERSELPIEAIQASTNPLEELHLSSITVAQVVDQAAREKGLATAPVVAQIATSTLTQIAGLLDELAQTGQPAQAAAPTAVVGAGPWVRAFGVELVPAEPGRPAGPSGAGSWQVFTPSPGPLTESLAHSLREAGAGAGVLLCLPAEADEGHVPVMLQAARAAIAQGADARFAVIGGRRGAAGLAKTLHLEAPGIATTVVVLDGDPAPGQIPELVAKVTADVATTDGFSEVRYDGTGSRFEPVLRALPRSAASGPATVLTDGDVMLVTGGGKGITAECALALGRATGATIAILGRSDPASDAELAANLQRLRHACVPFRYVSADVTSPDQVKAAVEEIEQTLGTVTAVLHGAGRNEPQALADLDEAAFGRTLAPKITGLRAVLAAVDPARLKLLVSFGSIIGRAGLSGEADYATANDWLTDLTSRTSEGHPGCRCLTLEWSVWAGAGMGERLGVLDALRREGIVPIPLTDGVDIFLELLGDPRVSGNVVVMGRAEGLPTITLERRQLPLTRFLERPLVHYPDVELVVDADLSSLTDPYLPDHLLDDALLLPAVIGMEAMAQVAGALTGQRGTPTLENMEFLRPIAVSPDDTATIRVAALADDQDTVHVVIRSESTGFKADHFRGTVRYSGRRLHAAAPELADDSEQEVALDPRADLYGSVLFQGGRFRRLLGYRKLAARECVAEISNRPGPVWFGDFMPPDLHLADPGTRDALMHSIQCCVPDATLLPVGIEVLRLADPDHMRDVTKVRMHARERSRVRDTYLYDLDVYDDEGAVVEQWRGLRLQAVRKQDGSGPWLPALLGPYLERNVEPLIGTGIRVAVQPARAAVPAVAADRPHKAAMTLSGALGREAEVSYGADGTPLEVGTAVSSSDTAGVALAVVSDRPTGCDVELAAPRPEEEWTALIGADGLTLARRIADERDEDLSVAAARVLSAARALNGRGEATVTLAEPAGRDSGRWALLRGGDMLAASFVTRLRSVAHPAVFTILAEAGESG